MGKEIFEEGPTNFTNGSEQLKIDKPLLPSHQSTEPAFLWKSPSVSFENFILRNKWIKKLLLIASIGIVAMFTAFKYFYPFANFIDGDSYYYIQAAFFNAKLGILPIGYSKFLRLFSIFSSSDTALVAFQYLAIQAGALYFLLSLFFFFPLTKGVQLVLVLLVVFNPVFLFLGNYVTSDSLFLALSLSWFAMLLHSLYKSSWRLMILQTIVLIIAFTFRYSALFYPMIAIIALMLSRQPLRRKALGIGLMALPLLAFISFNLTRYHRLTGTAQFTPFSGWQIVNNALYAYRKVDSADRKPVPLQFAKLDKEVRHYFDTSRDVLSHPLELPNASTVYMWTPNSPLRTYMQHAFSKNTPEFERWSKLAPLYKDYGMFLIRTYPELYFKHYLVVNSLKFYAPPLEFLEGYNMGRDTVASIAKQWFGYRTNKIFTRFPSPRVTSIAFVPTLCAIVNVLFLIGFLFTVMLGEWKGTVFTKRFLLLIGIVWLMHFLFSVIAAPVALRHQLFEIILTTSFSLIFIEYVYKTAFVQRKNESTTAEQHIAVS